MRVLVTGASGWLGSVLVERLLESGVYVRGLIRNQGDNLTNLSKKYGDKLEIVYGNIVNYDDCEKAMDGVEALYHLAGKAHSIPTSKEEEDEFLNINTYGSEVLFSIALKNKLKRVIFYSTVSVYSDSEDIITVESEKNPVTPYGKSKKLAEDIGLKLYKEGNLPITIIEPVTVYGGDDKGNFSKLKSLANRGLTIQFGNGNNKKTIIYYEDLIKATINIANDKTTIGKTIICGSEVIDTKTINNILSKSSKGRVVNLRINPFFTKFFLKVFEMCNFGVFKKIRRNIKVLSSNNEFDISYGREFLSGYLIFEDFNKIEN